MKGILGLLQIMRLLSCVSTVTSFPRNVFAVELGRDSGGIIVDIALGCVVGRVRLIMLHAHLELLAKYYGFIVREVSLVAYCICSG